MKVVFKDRKLIFPTYEPRNKESYASKGGFIDSNRRDTVKINKTKKDK